MVVPEIYPSNIAYWVSWFIISAIVAALAFIAFGIVFPKRDQYPMAKGIILSIWLIAVPLWFEIEYSFLYKYKGLKDTFEYFKYGQDLASRVWVAIAFVLSVLYFRKDFSIFREDNETRTKSAAGSRSICGRFCSCEILKNPLRSTDLQ